jgi:hypothetical protein
MMLQFYFSNNNNNNNNNNGNFCFRYFLSSRFISNCSFNISDMKLQPLFYFKISFFFFFLLLYLLVQEVHANFISSYKIN